MSETTLMALKCSRCKTEMEKNVCTKFLTKDGRYTKSVFCTACRRGKNKTDRGRTWEEIQELSVKNLPPVKILTKDEIAEIEHTITHPDNKKKTVPYLRAD